MGPHKEAEAVANMFRGDVQASEEAQENVHDRDLFVTVQMLSVNLACSGKNTVFPVSGLVVKSHI